MLKDFREFIVRGNVVDMGVGIILGAAFGSIVKSLVDDIIMPPIGLLLGGVDFSNFFIMLKAGAPGAPYASLADAQAAGAVTINYGLFINVAVSFVIIALAMFLLIRSINKLKREGQAPLAEPTTKECPFCISAVPIKATRCPHCTSELSNA